MFQQSGDYFRGKQDNFLLYLAKKTRDQLFVEDDDRCATLRPLFESLYEAFPGFASRWTGNPSEPPATAVFEVVPVLRAHVPGRLTR